MGRLLQTCPLRLSPTPITLLALTELLGLKEIQVVGHSSGALIALELAARKKDLIHSLILIEPAECGPFQVPAIAEIGERYIGPAMVSLGAGDLYAAFDSFMRACVENTIGR